MCHLVRAFFLNRDGATAIEYALIAGFISIVIVGAVNSIGITLDGSFQGVDAGLQ